MDGWETILSFWEGLLLVSGRVFLWGCLDITKSVKYSLFQGTDEDVKTMHAKNQSYNEWT